MVSNMLRFALCLFVLSSLYLTSSAQLCQEYKFPDHKAYANCRNLLPLNAFLHWNYSTATGQFDIAFRHIRVEHNRWVAWAINPKITLQQTMIGAQALVAIPQVNGAPKVYTSSIKSYDTKLEEGKIDYPINGLSVTYENKVVIIYATLTLPKGTKSIVHLWVNGPLLGSIPQKHELAFPDLFSKEVLNLI